MRALVVLHRYLGIGVGLLVTLWCLSGLVMMYQAFPELSRAERLAALPRLDLPHALRPPPLPDGAAVSGFEVEMVAGRPILTLTLSGGPPLGYDLTTGAPLRPISAAEAEEVAAGYARSIGETARPRHLGVIDQDQWTVATASRNGPVHWLALGDPANTQLYVGGATGRLFQQTTGAERALSWVGAIPHWLYLERLRQHPRAWAQVVIWSSVLGLFLTLTGLWLGVARFLERPKGRASPLRGLWAWHHLSGLAFGLLTVTWVFSGLLTMNPWGLFAGSARLDLRAGLTGDVTWGEVRRVLENAPALATDGAVQLRAAPLAGRLHVLRVSASGAAVRLDASGTPAPLQPNELPGAARRAGAPVAEIALLTDEDAYHYSHHAPAPLPVWRITFKDVERQQLYVDPTTGEVVRSVDQDARRMRWLQRALHDFDWPVLRRRPIWDLVVVPLLLGVTLGAASGAWLGLRRLRRNLGRKRREA